MTNQELRELDAWIAEKVMGYTLNQELGIRYKDGTESWGNSPEYTAQKCAHYQKQGLGCELITREDLDGFSPTYDPAAAMQVLEKCAKKDSEKFMGGMVIETWFVSAIGEDYEPHWRVACRMSRDKMPTDEQSLMTGAPTLPLAICLFAKKMFA